MGMPLVKCTLIEDCLAPRRAGKSVQKKAFRRGQSVVGTVSNIALTPDSQVLALKTKDGYLIPEPFLNIIGAVGEEKQQQQSQNKDPYYEEVQDAEVIDDKKENSVANVFNGLKTSGIISKNSVRSKQIVNFGIGGALIGIIYAMMKGKNKLMCAAIGAAGGGIIGNYVSNKLNENGKIGK